MIIGVLLNMNVRLLPFASVALALALAGSPQDEEKSPAPVIGKAAPAIRLNDQNGKAVSVGGETDHWTILAFFPKAATPG